VEGVDGTSERRERERERWHRENLLGKKFMLEISIFNF
jgi:hypothetical protein